MCGLAGHAGVDSQRIREQLTFGLGIGIDIRGGDAAGFATITEDKTIAVGHKPGCWINARERFLQRASEGTLSMLHARFATCGTGAITEAHPFVIKREGKTILFGAHNGIIYNAYSSAQRNGRKLTVDSKELFELLADKDYEGLKRLQGYGVITWIEADNPTCMFVHRLTAMSDFHIEQLEHGGFVWGSTREIVARALDMADLNYTCHYDLDVGVTYRVTPTAITIPNMPLWQIGSGFSFTMPVGWHSVADEEWAAEFRTAMEKDKSDAV